MILKIFTALLGFISINSQITNFDPKISEIKSETLTISPEEHKIEALLKQMNYLAEHPSADSYNKMRSILQALIELRPELQLYFDRKKSDFTVEGLKLLNTCLRKFFHVCGSKEEWGSHLRMIQKSKEDFSGAFLIKGNHAKEMLPDDRWHPTRFDELLQMGLLTQEQHDEILLDFHLTLAYVHKTKSAFTIYFIDSLGFAKSFALKKYCLYLGTFEDIPHINVYIFPTLRQNGLSGCSVFAFEDALNMSPESLAFIKEHSKPSEEFWKDMGYMSFIGAEKASLCIPPEEFQREVSEEYQQYLDSSMSSVPLDYNKFLINESKVYKSFHKSCVEKIHIALKPNVANLHLFSINRLPPKMMTYTQSLTLLNQYDSSLHEGISEHLFEVDETLQNKMIEHLFIQYSRILIKHILETEQQNLGTTYRKIA